MKIFRITCLLLTIAFLGLVIYTNYMAFGFHIITVSASRGARILAMRKISLVIFLLLACMDALMFAICFHLTHEKTICPRCGKTWYTKDLFCKKCGEKLLRG